MARLLSGADFKIIIPKFKNKKAYIGVYDLLAVKGINLFLYCTSLVHRTPFALVIRETLSGSDF